MNRTIYSTNNAIINLTKTIYSKQQILTSLQIYQDFIKGIIKETPTYYQLELIKTNPKEQSPPIKKITNEFLNYLISLEYTTIKTK